MASVLTYDALREIQYNEKKSEKLVELEDSFYESIEEYFNRKGPKDDLTEIELRNAKNILKDIQDRRERKILSQALVAVRSGMRINTSMMTNREENLFKNLVIIMKTHREEMAKPVKRKSRAQGRSRAGALKAESAKAGEPESAKAGKPESEEPVEPTISYIKVKILEELPEIVGADFDTYGPFKTGDIVKIPDKNADIFIEKGKAEKIKK